MHHLSLCDAFIHVTWKMNLTQLLSWKKRKKTIWFAAITIIGSERPEYIHFRTLASFPKQNIVTASVLVACFHYTQ